MKVNRPPSTPVVKPTNSKSIGSSRAANSDGRLRSSYVTSPWLTLNDPMRDPGKEPLFFGVSGLLRRTLGPQLQEIEASIVRDDGVDGRRVDLDVGE